MALILIPLPTDLQAQHFTLKLQISGERLDDDEYIWFVSSGLCVSLYNDSNTLCTAVRQRVKYAQSEIYTFTWARIMGKLRSGITELSCYVGKLSTVVSLSLISALGRNISRFSSSRVLVFASSISDRLSIINISSKSGRSDKRDTSKLNVTHIYYLK